MGVLIKLDVFIVALQMYVRKHTLCIEYNDKEEYIEDVYSNRYSYLSLSRDIEKAETQYKT